MTQAMVTIAVRIGVDLLGEALRRIDALGNPAGPIAALIAGEPDTEFVHFVSLHAIQSHLPDHAFIVCEFSADGAADAAIEKLTFRAGEMLLPIFGLADSGLTMTGLAAFLKRHRINVGYGLFQPAGLPFSGVPGMSVPRIKHEKALAETIAGLLADPGDYVSALATLETVKRVIAADPDSRWALDAVPNPPPGPTRESSVGEIIMALAPSLVATFLWPILLVAVPISLWIAWPSAGWTWALHDVALCGFADAVDNRVRAGAGLFCLPQRRGQ